MCLEGRPEENLGEVIEDRLSPTADSSGSTGGSWKGFRMKPRGDFVGVGVREVKRHAYDVLSWMSSRSVGNEPA